MWETTVGVVNGDTRSLDYSSVLLAYCNTCDCLAYMILCLRAGFTNTCTHGQKMVMAHAFSMHGARIRASTLHKPTQEG